MSAGCTFHYSVKHCIIWHVMTWVNMGLPVLTLCPESNVLHCSGPPLKYSKKKLGWMFFNNRPSQKHQWNCHGYPPVKAVPNLLCPLKVGRMVDGGTEPARAQYCNLWVNKPLHGLKKFCTASTGGYPRHSHSCLGNIFFWGRVAAIALWSSIPLSRFWISATCGVNKNFYIVSLLEIGLTKYEVTDGWVRNCIWSTQFPGGIQDISFYLHHERHDHRIFEFGTLLNILTVSAHVIH